MINDRNYLNHFEQAAALLNNKSLKQKGIKVMTGIWLDSVVLRMQKAHWANDPSLTPQTGASIFFSIWLHNKTLRQQRISYNIHALKLRQLKGYKLTSRAFAASFRKQFKPFQHKWPNISVDYGPLTLMEGWQTLDETHLTKDLVSLANQFLEIEFIIEDLLQ